MAGELYAAPPTDVNRIWKHKPGQIICIPPRPFAWNTQDYWAWWKGFIAGNSITVQQFFDAIEADRNVGG